MEKRRRYTPQQKVAILREHLKDRVPISEVCKKHNINPNMFYKWEKQFFEGGIEVFKQKRKNIISNTKENQLKEKVSNLQEVISEITKENIILKKKYNGEI